MSTSDSDDEAMLRQARDRAEKVLNTVGGDLDSLRAAGSDANYADGAALCEQVAEATRQLMAQLDADLRQAQSNSPHQSPHP